ncbi:helix-turn-helix domain-containing protein [Sulfuricystis multivorans]|uniref:helix-turn-helix domain-containing protein n=1 Tax=Sulfuricystis multivorans TaxID=2211108 RepID=UPI000F844906|nr:helix-turn-helix transcriptional regulator [Sulfuricystis multivorans]
MSLIFPVTWRLRECMEAANIHTVTELHHRIMAIAPDTIKYAQLARIVQSPPARLNLQTLAVLTIVLGCRPGDLLDPQPNNLVTRNVTRQRKKRNTRRGLV